MTWKKYTSKTFNREYWFNSETNKSVWEKPQDLDTSLQNSNVTASIATTSNVTTSNVIASIATASSTGNQRNLILKQRLIKKRKEELLKKESENKKKSQEIKSSEVIDNDNNIDNIIEDIHKLYIESKPKVEKPKVKKPIQSYTDSNKYERTVYNGYGHGWTIEGQSHWTDEDYREKVRDMNEAMRDMYR